MSFEVNRVIGNDHPALAGHFPDNPIVPGVLILEEVVLAAEQWRGRVRLKSVASVKFSAPLRPGNEFSIELNEQGESQITFACRIDEMTFASGILTVEPDSGVS